MINSDNHESMDEPPNIPAITGIEPKRSRKMSFNEAIVEAATSFASALKPPEQSEQTTKSDTSSTGGLSPGKVAELRSRKLQELRELQQLLEGNILTKEEFTEQKDMVLSALRKLTY